MTVSIRSTFITQKNVTTAEANIKSGNVKAAGVTPSGDVVVEVRSDTTRKISHLIINSEGTLVTHFCESVKKLPLTGSTRSCWHLAIAMLALHTAYPERKAPDLPHPIEVAVTFPEEALINKDITPDLIGCKGEFNRCTFLPLDLPQDEANTQAPEEAAKIPTIELSKEDAWLGELNLPPSVLAKVMLFRDRQYIDLDEEQMKRVPQNVNYEAQGNELVQTVSALVYGKDAANWEPVLLRGPKGTGKSTLVNKVAEIFMLPVNRISGSTDHDLDGRARCS